MTRAETLLWRYLKANRIDALGFRRQVPIRNYIADFVCFSAKLIIELDGESHDFEERRTSDRVVTPFSSPKVCRFCDSPTNRCCRIWKVLSK
jgi:very-short-patch-repair endonuclease